MEITADLEEAIKAYGTGDYAKTFPVFESYAESENDRALLYLGLSFQFGNGTLKNSEKAVYYYHESAKRGNMSAAYRLGEAYSSGSGIEKDRLLAERWLVLAIEKGADERAYRALAWLYHSEFNDDQKAFNLFSRGVEKFACGHCYYGLAWICVHGDKALRNLDSALENYIKAAEKDDRSYNAIAKLISGEWGGIPANINIDALLSVGSKAHAAGFIEEAKAILFIAHAYAALSKFSCGLIPVYGKVKNYRLVTNSYTTETPISVSTVNNHTTVSGGGTKTHYYKRRLFDVQTIGSKKFSLSELEKNGVWHRIDDGQNVILIEFNKAEFIYSIDRNKEGFPLKTMDGEKGFSFGNNHELEYKKIMGSFMSKLSILSLIPLAYEVFMGRYLLAFGLFIVISPLIIWIAHFYARGEAGGKYRNKFGFYFVQSIESDPLGIDPRKI